MQKYLNNIASSTTGLPIAGASVQVNLLAGGAASLFSDNGVTPRANPIITESKGYFEFYAADGRYSLVVSGTGFTPFSITDILLQDPVDADVFNVSALTATGITLNGDMVINGTGRKLRADWSNATMANRLTFQSLTGNTGLVLIPNSLGGSANVNVYNNTDPTNSSWGAFGINAASVNIFFGAYGTGVLGPLIFNSPASVGGINEVARMSPNGDINLCGDPSTRALQLTYLAGSSRAVTVRGSVADSPIVGTTAGTLHLAPAGVVKAGVDANGLLAYSGSDPLNANILSMQSVVGIGQNFIGGKSGTGVENLPFYFIGAFGGNPCFTMIPAVSGYNGINAYGAAIGNDVQLIASGVDTDVNLRVSSKGNRNVHLLTNGSASLEVSIAPTSGNAARYLIMGGALAGGAPYITTSAGNLSLGSANAGVMTVNDGAGGVNFQVSNGGGGVQRNWISAQGATSGGGTPSLIASSDGTDPNVGMQLLSKGTGLLYFGTNATVLVAYQAAIEHIANTTKQVYLRGAVAAGNPGIKASGGNLVLGSANASMLQSATDGYVMIPSCAGAPSGVPTNNGLGQIAMHYDSTNNRIYFYNGSWRSVAVT